MSTMWYASCHVVVPAVMPIAPPGRTIAARGHRDRVLLAHVAQRLGLEAGLVGGAFVAQRRAAVHLQQQAGLVEQVEIAAHGHVADGQQRGQLADAHGAAAADLGDDHLVALACQHTRRDRVDRTLHHVR